MLIKILEFLVAPNNEDIIDALQTLYQQKVELLFLAAITT